MRQAALSNSTTAPAQRDCGNRKYTRRATISDDHRAQLREVMLLAWDKMRWERTTMRREYTMSEALKHAWAWVKGAAERIAAQVAWAAGPKTVTHLRSIMRSPIKRSLGGQRYAGALDYSAARYTERLGY